MADDKDHHYAKANLKSGKLYQHKLTQVLLGIKEMVGYLCQNHFFAPLLSVFWAPLWRSTTELCDSQVGTAVARAFLVASFLTIS